MTPLTGPVPRVFALPHGLPFARHFAAGLHVRFRDAPPEMLARTNVMVNTRRALRAIEQALADLAPRPGPLPRLMLMPELHADPLAAPGVAPSVLPLRRQLRLMRLVEHFLTEAREPIAPPGAAADLAEALALLIDSFHDAAVAPASLDTMLEGSGLADGSAAHWERTLQFVDIVRQQWPAICTETEGGAIDPSARQNAVIEAMVTGWLTDPPPHPVIAAASTGSVGSTARLMAAIANLPQGALVLPGFDPGIEPSIWQAAGPDHPAGVFKPLLDRIGILPDAVQFWGEAPESPRRILLNQALRPAPVTDHWHEAAADLSPLVDDATAGLSLIEAESPRHEAEAIAVAIREVLETPGATVGLVSPDAALARRVTAALDRFDIVPDDTLGQPLALSPPAVLLRLILDVASGQYDSVHAAALLQHPLVQPGIDRSDHLRFARRYEQAVLRGVAARCGGGMLPSWPDADPGGADWLRAANEALSPLAEALVARASLAHTAGALRAAAERLTDAGGGPAIWAKDAGGRLDAMLADLEAQADAYGDGPVAGFPALVASLLRGQSLPPEPERPHPRVAIWGPREARVQGADLMILSGLNHGVWPAAADPGPWLSRPMHQALGLPLPELTVGLAAHDFLQGTCQPRVLLTRSRKVEGTPTVPSRWLIRLETLVTGIGAEAAMRAMRSRGERYLGLATALGRHDHQEPPAPRPRPHPPPEARPRRLSVTRIEELIRDAYAVYAREILRLRPVEPLGRPADARERGNVMHAVLERFVQRTIDWPGPGEACRILMEVADEVLANSVPWPDLRRIWRARIERFAGWFIDREDRRRTTGQPIAWERRGTMGIDLPGGEFVITAKADRIDLLNDGSAAIYDYKTGEPPSQGQIEHGYNQQIHLQAAILASGGFDGLESLQATQGAYVGLTGSGEGGKETCVEISPDDVARHMTDMAKLLAAFEETASYVSHGRPELTRHRGDYDHLARRGEWSGEDE